MGIGSSDTYVQCQIGSLLIIWMISVKDSVITESLQTMDAVLGAGKVTIQKGQ